MTKLKPQLWMQQRTSSSKYSMIRTGPTWIQARDKVLNSSRCRRKEEDEDMQEPEDKDKDDHHLAVGTARDRIGWQIVQSH